MKLLPSVLVRRFAILALVLTCLGGSALGYVRIVLNGKTLYWGSNVIEWKLSTPGFDGIVDDGSYRSSVRHGLESWEDVYGTNLHFRFDGETTGTNYSSHSSHLVMVDNDNSTGFFPVGTGMVAVTPLSYRLSDGKILDADILLNARDWNFSADRSQGTFDIQDIITHEAGHLIGLDHSASLASSMWPYVSTSQWHHRSLSADDQAGAVALKPYGGDSRLNGRILSPQGGGISGAIVGIINSQDGRQATTVLSDSNGNWTVRGLAPGDYLVYATPLEGGMSSANLTGDTNVDTQFSSGFYGGFHMPLVFSVGSGQILSCGDWTMPADSNLQDNASYSKRFRVGETKTINLTGSGFSPNGMQVETKSPFVSAMPIAGGTSWCRVLVSTTLDAPIGQYDLFLSHPSGDIDAIPSAIEVIAEAPSIQSLSQSAVSIHGGELLQIHGSGFQPGCWVVIGGREVVSSTLLSSDILEVVVPEHDGGVVDVMIQNPDAQSDIIKDSLTYVAVPTFSSLWPIAGQTSGGTRTLLHGEDFSNGIQVFIGGRPAPTNWRSTQLLEVTTPSGNAGSADLVLRNPGSPDVTELDAFRFVQTQDPEVLNFTPSSGKGGGGALVKIYGQNLENSARVFFGVDSATGLGGVEGDSLEAVASTEIQVRSPHYREGSWGVRLELANGQGIMAPGNFLFEAAPVVGGCAGVVGRPGTFSGWGELPAFLMLFIGAWVFRRKKNVWVRRAGD